MNFTLLRTFGAKQLMPVPSGGWRARALVDGFTSSLANSCATQLRVYVQRSNSMTKPDANISNILYHTLYIPILSTFELPEGNPYKKGRRGPPTQGLINLLEKSPPPTWADRPLPQFVSNSALLNMSQRMMR